MSNPSASSLERVDICPASQVLTPRAEETGDQAERGSQIHEYTRRVGMDPTQREAALECVPIEWRKTAANVDFETALADLAIVLCEPAYAVDAVTGGITFLGENIHRDYNGACKRMYGRDLLATEFCVSLDVEAMHKDGYPCAADYKTGIKRTPCSEMWQMLLQSYVLAVKYDSHQGEARVVYIAETGNVTLDSHIFSRMELDEVPVRLMDIIRRVDAAATEIAAGRIPAVSIGSHCTYCPALRGCPAQTALAKSMLSDLTIMDVSVINELSAEQCGAAYTRLKAIQALAYKIEDSLKARIKQEGELAADRGYVWRVTEQSKMGLNADRVRGLLTVLNASQEQIESITTKSTFPVIRRVKEKK